MTSRSSSPPVAGATGAPPGDIATLVQQVRDEWQQQTLRKQHPELEVIPPAEPVEPLPADLLAGLTRRYTLPPAYQAMLRAIGRRGFSVLPGPFQELIVYAGPELELAQVGFRGPRPGDDGFVAPHGWRRTWVVIAYDAGDPYFLDVTRVNRGGECPVWMAMHGTGTWEPRLVASSVAQFLQLLRAWIRAVVPHYDPQNPDEPLDDAHLRRLTAEITQIDPAATSHWTL